MRFYLIIIAILISSCATHPKRKVIVRKPAPKAQATQNLVKKNSIIVNKPTMQPINSFKKNISAPKRTPSSKDNKDDTFMLISK